MYIQKKGRKVLADEEVFVEPEASDLLFEAEDVAELVAEVTGEQVDVAAEDNFVTFTVGEDEFTVTAEGDEEILESRKVAPKRNVNASTRRKVENRRRSTAMASRENRPARPVKANVERRIASTRKPVRSSRNVRVVSRNK